MERRPKFSVIIPVHNNLKYTIECIDSVIRNTEDFELIIIDDGSIDETPEWLKGLSRRCGKEGVSFLKRKNIEGKGFPVACNMGAKISTGDHLIFLNNDTLVTPFWAAKMAACLEQAPEVIRIGKFGITGPATNYAAGQQMVVGATQEYTLDKLDEYAELWGEHNPQKWVYTGFISGFCMMIIRECWTDVGGFDERFSPGGYEDNDICNRAYSAGWKSIVTGDAFIHHHGSKTLNTPEFQFMKGGLANRGKYFSKYWDGFDKKLEDGTFESQRVPVVAGYRVKNAGRWIEESLTKTLQCVDHACLLDDGSTDDTPKIISQMIENNPGRITSVRHDREFQELRDRNELWTMMRNEALSINSSIEGWGIIIDGDEMFEDKVTDEYIQYLARPIHPDVHGYIFKVDTFWRGRDKIRADGTFGDLKGVRMVRFVKDQKLWTHHPQGLHCGNTPSTPPDWLAMSNVHLKHFGYEDYDIVEAKEEFYRRVDTVKDPMSVGGDGSYSHLTDESALSLVPWRENNTLGLAMIGKDEAEFLPQFFEKNYWYTMFDQIIYVDCGSSDDSKSLASVYGAHVYDLPDNLIYQDGKFKGRLKHFGKARNFAASKLQTEWILFMDADEYFDMEDRYQFMRLLETDFQAFRFHVQNHQPDGNVSHSENFRLYRNIPDLFWTQHVHESLETAITAMGSACKVSTVNFPLHHLGYLRGQDYVQLKLDHYEVLNDLDREADPDDARPYFNNALHYLNDGNNEKAVEYLSKCCALHPTFMQAHRELGLIFMRKAMPLIQQAYDTCPDRNPNKADLERMLQYLIKYAGEPLKVGRAGGTTQEKTDELIGKHDGESESGSA